MGREGAPQGGYFTSAEVPSGMPTLRAAAFVFCPPRSVVHTASSAWRFFRQPQCCACKRNHTGGYEFEFAAQAEPELLEGEEWRDVVLG